MTSFIVSTYRKSYLPAFSISVCYAIQAMFYSANYWSLGFVYSWKTIVVFALMLSPVAGFLWFGYIGFLFEKTGRWLGGKANRKELSYAIAWSKMPVLCFVPIWTYFIFYDPERVFILGAKDPSPILINGISLLFGSISQFIRVQSIRRLQGFSFSRSILNVTLSLFISAITSFLVFLFVRFVLIIV